MNNTIQFPIGTRSSNLSARTRDRVLVHRIMQRLANQQDREAIKQSRVVNGARLIQLK